MQSAWTNPFADQRQEIDWRSCVGDLSDDDESFPDQVVYHEDHLENLFGLYNRAEEDKDGGPSQMELLKTGVESYKDQLVVAAPSNRETAVWDALQASGLNLQEAFQVAENDRAQLSTLKGSEKEQVFGNCLDDGPTDESEDEDNAIANCQLAEAGYLEASNGDKVSPKDGRDHTTQNNADMDDSWCHVAGLSSLGPISKCLVKQPKGRYKKKLNFSFRPICNLPSVHRRTERRDDCQNLSITEKLQSLAETNYLTASKMNVANCSALCRKVPMCEKLLGLIQTDSSHVSQKKARKAFSTEVKMNAYKHCVKMDKVAAGGVTHNHALEREDRSTESIKAPIVTINDKFRNALLAAPPASTEDLNKQGQLQGFVFGFAARLQKVLEREKNDQAHFLKMLQTRDDCQGWLNFMDVKILTKSLEARLSTCLCEVLKFPKAYAAQATSDMKVIVIFNMQMNAQLELEVGRVIRVHSPWQEVLKEGDVAKTILCTYYCEVLSSPDTI